MSNNKKPDMQQILFEIYLASAGDKTFRNICLKSPKEAYKKVAGEYPPESLRLNFIEDPKAQKFCLPEFRGGQVPVDEVDDLIYETEEPLEKLFMKATFNRRFRNLCLSKPYEAIREFMEEDMPTGELFLNFTEDPDEQSFLLPPFVEKE